MSLGAGKIVLRSYALRKTGVIDMTQYELQPNKNKARQSS